MKEEVTAIATPLTNAEINARVHAQTAKERKFSKAEMACKETAKRVALARKERRETLAKTSKSEIARINAEIVDQGYKLGDVQKKVLKTQDKVVVEYVRKHAEKGAADKLAESLKTMDADKIAEMLGDKATEVFEVMMAKMSASAE